MWLPLILNLWGYNWQFSQWAGNMQPVARVAIKKSIGSHFISCGNTQPVVETTVMVASMGGGGEGRGGEGRGGEGRPLSHFGDIFF